MNTGDPVTSREHRAGFSQFHLLVIALNLALDNFADLGSFQFHCVLVLLFFNGTRTWRALFADTRSLFWGSSQVPVCRPYSCWASASPMRRSCVVRLASYTWPARVTTTPPRRVESTSTVGITVLFVR